MALAIERAGESSVIVDGSGSAVTTHQDMAADAVPFMFLFIAVAVEINIIPQLDSLSGKVICLDTFSLSVDDLSHARQLFGRRQRERSPAYRKT